MEPILIKVNSDIILRQYQIEDSEGLANLVESTRSYIREWLPWVDMNKTIEDSKIFIEGALEGYKNSGIFELGIWYKEQLVGSIGIHSYSQNNKSTAIGYWLSHQFWGEGIMINSVKGLLNYLFNEMKLNRVEIRCGVGNERSCTIPKRLGFTHEGILRQAEKFPDHFNDLNVFSMLASEWNE